ncbi:MAG: hypothetical protein O2854_04800, partial [Chloroflexi bacterium]|nr:hypothetical protein [Chloroflexota bacterium]
MNWSKDAHISGRHLSLNGNCTLWAGVLTCGDLHLQSIADEERRVEGEDYVVGLGFEEAAGFFLEAGFFLAVVFFAPVVLAEAALVLDAEA